MQKHFQGEQINFLIFRFYAVKFKFFYDIDYSFILKDLGVTL